MSTAVEARIEQMDRRLRQVESKAGKLEAGHNSLESQVTGLSKTFSELMAASVAAATGGVDAEAVPVTTDPAAWSGGPEGLERFRWPRREGDGEPGASVLINVTRGLTEVHPASLELMRSYAATDRQIYRKLRFPASLPYLFTALKIAATASIVGAIVGEGPGGIPNGLGRVLDTYNQYYITGPEKLWAAIIACGLLGVTFFLLVRAAEVVILRGRPGAAEG
jgi:hypothetical protein